MPTSIRKHLILAATLLFPIALLALESIFFPGVLFKNLEITPIMVILFGWLMQLALRFSAPAITNRWQYLALAIGSVGLFFLSLGLMQLDAIIHPTFTLRTFGIHPAPLEFIFWFLSGVLVIYARRDWLRQLHPYSTAIAPLVLLGIFMSLQHHYAHEIFAKLKVEDGPFEYGTFATFLAGSGFAAVTARRLWQSSRDRIESWPLILGFALAALAFFFVAGEEISWGQRILGIETPAEYAAVNTQNELTIHNHHAVINYVYYTYLTISALAMTVWIPTRIVEWLVWRDLGSWLRWITPRWWLATCFIPMLVYVPLRETYGYIRFGHWEEMSELFFSFGLSGHLLYTMLRARRTEVTRFISAQLLPETMLEKFSK